MLQFLEKKSFISVLIKPENMHYLSFSISIAFISWIIGMIGNELIKNKPFYEELSNLNFITSAVVNKGIGLEYFKWIVKNTPFKYFNQKIKLNSKVEISQLYELRKEMTFSEISHLIAFTFVAIFALFKVFDANYVGALIMMIVNLLMNLYPSLLQQENKRRIDRFLRVKTFKDSKSCRSN